MRTSWNTFLATFVRSDVLLLHIQKLHLALFYLFGNYLQLSKRLTGVRYVFVRDPGMDQPGYQLLGVLLIIQLYITTIRFLLRFLKPFSHSDVTASDSASAADDYVIEGVDDALPEEKETEKEEADGLGSEAVQCTLCLSPRRFTTATECGHLFCWSCISECCTNKPECPLCRTPCSVNQLLRLSHYS